MTTEQRIEVSRLIHASASTVFALLRDPRRHPELDGSGTLRAAPDAAPITKVGDEFVMELQADDLGSYRSRSVVIAYDPHRQIAWSPGPVDEPPFGHIYRYTLTPTEAEHTSVTQTYDWSAVSDPRLDGQLPRISRDELARTLELLAVRTEHAPDAT